MFDSNYSDEEGVGASQIRLVQKKRKLDCKTDVVHSSLSYETFKAPPLIEYKSIDSYCGNKLGKSLLPTGKDDSHATFRSDVSSISSPIVLKSQKTTPGCSIVNSSVSNPSYIFFSVEELSLVRSLSNWTNTKVCPVGRVELDLSTQECYLHSVLEKGSWHILLDTSMMVEIPKVKIVLQLFGSIEVNKEVPVLKVNFYRDLGSTDVTLFVQSYRMMQKFVPNFLNLPKKDDDDEDINNSAEALEAGCLLNDTLDSYNLSAVEGLMVSE